MRIADALIAWTPAQGARTGTTAARRGTPGAVTVAAWPDQAGLTGSHLIVAGAGDEQWRRAADDVLLARLFILFNTMVLRDGINPLTAHINLLDIDEYRAAVAQELLCEAAPPPVDSVVDLDPYLQRLKRAKIAAPKRPEPLA